MKARLPILVGPTGIGKSEVAYHLALRLNSEIISADAFQVYRGMEIGTAQPPKEWQKKVPHHLVGVKKPSESWNAVKFALQALEIIEKGKEENKNFLMVGGAGFYLKTLVEGAPPGEAPSQETREFVLSKIKELGREKTYAWLEDRDLAAAKRIHVNDSSRIQRALEKTFVSKFSTEKLTSSFKPLGPKNVLFIGLERSRTNLDRLLLERTRTMWSKGLVNEAKNLIKRKIPRTHPLWAAIGYAEAVAYSLGELKQEEAIERIFRRTRQYAKRQWTWFKHQHKVEWIDLDNFSDILPIVGLLEKMIKG